MDTYNFLIKRVVGDINSYLIEHFDFEIMGYILALESHNNSIPAQTNSTPKRSTRSSARKVINKDGNVLNTDNVVDTTVGKKSFNIQFVLLFV